MSENHSSPVDGEASQCDCEDGGPFAPTSAAIGVRVVTGSKWFFK